MPAATIVAAWISAEAGVGPSMASGSQSWNGSWADLPATPKRRQSSAAVRSVVDGAAASDSAPGGTAAVQWPMTAGMAVVRAPAARMMIPITKARSAMRVTRNALTAARRAASRRLSWPMSRNEHQPMTSHPTRVRTRSPDWTTSSIAARKSETVAANTA